MTPSQPDYTKSPPKTSGSSYFLIEKLPKKAYFIYKNLKEDILQKHFVRNRSRRKNIFTSSHFELYLFKVSGVIYTPSHPD
jgi:hypothetical protein